MQFRLVEAIEVLADTPAVLDALLRNKSAAWLRCRKSPDAFSPVDVVGHLMLADATNWLPRARMILDTQDQVPLCNFDRFDFKTLIADKSIESLLDDFAARRRDSLRELTAMDLGDHLDLRGTHPQFGPVTLGNLLATWVVHDLGHVQQIVKTMANEYGDAVGPWQAYLTILH